MSLLWLHSPILLKSSYAFFPPLHKQYKEVDRSERGLCEKIIKSFRECQESIAQHCQHSGVLQAIIRWHGGVRHAWQLIPAWSPREKKKTKSGLHEMSGKVGEQMYRTRFFQGSASFSQMANYFGGKFLCLLTSIHVGRFICAQNSEVLQDLGRYLSSLYEWDHSSLASKNYPYYWVKLHLFAFFLFWDYNYSIFPL